MAMSHVLRHKRIVFSNTTTQQPIEAIDSVTARYLSGRKIPSKARLTSSQVKLNMR